jgi:hypothetical protein
MKKQARTYDEKANRQKVPVGLRLDADVLERLRNAVWHLGQGLTVNGIIESAAGDALDGLEKKHNHGRPFPARKGPIGRGSA